MNRPLIDLGNGPEIASSRTQLMKRLVDFYDRHQLTLGLAYDPPYHGKCNCIEQYCGILKNHRNHLGTVQDHDLVRPGADRASTESRLRDWRPIDQAGVSPS